MRQNVRQLLAEQSRIDRNQHTARGTDGKSRDTPFDPGVGQHGRLDIPVDAMLDQKRRNMLDALGELRPGDRHEFITDRYHESRNLFEVRTCRLIE